MKWNSLLLVFAHTDFISHVSTATLTILAFNTILDFVKYLGSFYLNFLLFHEKI